MKILLINPPRVNGYPVVREERFEHKDIGSVYPPLSLLSTASILERAGHEVKLIDANGFDLKLGNIKKELIKQRPEAVFIRTGFDTHQKDLEVLALAKKETGAVTLARNHIISRTPWLRKKLLLKNRFVDYFLNQEPESVLLPLLKSIEKGKRMGLKGVSSVFKNKAVDFPDADLVKDLDKLPFPAYHLLPNLNVYYSGTFGPPFVMIQGSRGCPYQCGFCAYSRQTYRARSAGSISKEIEWLAKKWGIKDFCFWDDIVTLEERRMIEICQAIVRKKLNLRWSVGIRADVVTKKMLILMKKAGCDEIAVGVESGSEKILKKINKKETLEDMRQTAKLCHDLKIKFYAMFIIGLPGETEKTVEETIKFAKSLGSFYTQFCFAVPFPNTKIYKYYKRNKFLLAKDWREYFPLSDYPAAKTKALSAKKLISLRNRAYRTVLFDPKYLLSQVKLNDWRWNARGFKEIGKRMLALLGFKPVR